MNRTLQLKAILLFFVFLSFGRATINAQCIFYNQTERLQYAAIKAIYDQNSKVFFSSNLNNFVNQQICSICDIPEVYCEREKVVGLSFRGSNLTTMPREIAAFPDLQFLYLDNNQLSCLPKEVAVICAGNAANLTLEGNPIFNTTGFFDFCANPRDICIPSKSFDLCDNLGFINYLDTLYILGLGEKYSKVEIIGANTGWKVFPICENCDDLQLINDLPDGEYTLKINLTDKNGQSCYREEKITIARNGIQPTPPATNIGDINCDQLEFEITGGDVYINGLTANYNKVEYIGANTNWKVVLECDGTCSTNTLIPSLKVGTYTTGLGNTCYREKIVSIDNANPTLPDDGELGSINCDGLEFEVNFDGVYISGLTAVYNKVEYIGANTDWKVIRECDGDCPSIRLVQGLKQGTYTFKVFQSGEFGENCYHEETIRIDSDDLPYPSEQNGQLNCDNLVFDGFVNQIYVGNLMASGLRMKF